MTRRLPPLYALRAFELPPGTPLSPAPARNWR